MDKKTLMITLGAAAVVTGLGVMISNSQQATAELDTPLVLPELADNAQSLERIKLETAGNTLVVESHKQDGQWVIDNLGNYDAETASLSGLIKALKDSKKVEAKTSRANLYHHLGLRDISDPQSKATLITLSTADKSYQLLVGNSAKNGTGQYVRLVGEKQSWLIDKAIDKPTAAEDWVNTKLFDFGLDDVQSVSLSGKFSYQLSKADKEQQSFTLQPLPDTHELKYDSIVDAVPRSVSSLRFDHLLALDELPQLTESQSLLIKQFEQDSQIEITVAKGGDKYYAQLKGDDPLWQKWAYEISEFNYNQLAKDSMDYLNEKQPQQPEVQGVEMP